ncbi:hypothetical protein T4E_6355 [Trichinella pseudospiralis]|uniref:Uncharacterized protein n=1 Tax=Trichinella pseudospiralis TaxID=6337 RepID=A0A0V0XA80_TRIPS|nr:hypothetical protein T4E_6355 [Trichinella pseudospiralis]
MDNTGLGVTKLFTICWREHGTRELKCGRRWQGEKARLALCEWEIAAYPQKKGTEVFWGNRIVESTLPFTNSALLVYENGTAYLKFLDSCGEKAAHL